LQGATIYENGSRFLTTCLLYKNGCPMSRFWDLGGALSQRSYSLVVEGPTVEELVLSQVRNFGPGVLGLVGTWVAPLTPASTAAFIAPQLEKKRIRPPVSGSLVGESRRAGVSRACCSSPVPWASKSSVASLRARSRSKLSATKTNFPRVAISTGPSLVVKTPNSKLVAISGRSAAVGRFAPTSAFSPEYLRPRLSA